MGKVLGVVLIVAIVIGLGWFIMPRQVEAAGPYETLGRCSPYGICTACSNCSACKHCSQDGGTCSVCR